METGLCEQRVSSYRTAKDTTDAVVKLFPKTFPGSPATRRADTEDGLAVT